MFKVLEKKLKIKLEKNLFWFVIIAVAVSWVFSPWLEFSVNQIKTETALAQSETPSRKIRLFEGFTIKLVSGKMMLNQSIRTDKYLTGYNADIIADGSGTAAETTLFTADGDFVYYSEDWVSAPSGYGLSADGIFVSADSGRDIEFNPYNENNALLLSLRTGYPTTGTLTLSSPESFTSIPFIGASGAGVSTWNVTVNFSDSTTQSGTLTLPDWYNATPYAINAKGRVRTSNNAIDSNSSNPRFYELEFAIDAGNQSKLVESIDFSINHITTTPTGYIMAIADYL